MHLAWHHKAEKTELGEGTLSASRRGLIKGSIPEEASVASIEYEIVFIYYHESVIYRGRFEPESGQDDLLWYSWAWFYPARTEARRVRGRGSSFGLQISFRENKNI